MQPRLYLAAPLFSHAELVFNTELKRRLSPFFEVFLPQEDGQMFVELAASGGAIDEAAHRIADVDRRALSAADYVLAVLDGRTIDEGVAFELGYAAALGKECFGLHTDPRRLLPIGNNPMISTALTHTYDSVEQLVTEFSSTYGGGFT